MCILKIHLISHPKLPTHRDKKLATICQINDKRTKRRLFYLVKTTHLLFVNCYFTSTKLYALYQLAVSKWHTKNEGALGAFKMGSPCCLQYSPHIFIQKKNLGFSTWFFFVPRRHTHSIGTIALLYAIRASTFQFSISCTCNRFQFAKTFLNK